MKKQFKDLFLKASWIGIKGLFLLPFALYIINDALDVYGYAEDKSSYSIVIFVIFAALLLLNFAIITFTKIKVWKIISTLILSIIYISMHYISDDVILSGQIATCIEGNYNECVLKDRFNEP